MSERAYIDHLDTPIGRLALVTNGDGALVAAGFVDGHARMEKRLDNDTLIARESELRAPIAAYFASELTALDDVPVAYEGTPFQRSVWDALRTIPCRETRSYREIARQIGRPAAVRAVGLANGQNPIALVVPCHRVIGADGSLTGYAGGLDRKRWLLAHEGTKSLSAPAPGYARGA